MDRTRTSIQALPAVVGLCLALVGCAAKRELRQGEAALSDGKISAAEHHFHEALEARPGLPAALHGLARAAMADGRPEAAITPARTAWEQGVAEAGPVLAAALVAVGRGAEAEPVLAKLNGDDPALAAVRAEAALAVGDRARARSLLAPVVEQSRDARAIALAAWLCARAEDAACATSLAGRALSLAPDDADVVSEVAAVMRSAGARDEAATAASRARGVLRVRPSDYARAAEQRASAGDLEGALRLWARARALDPADGPTAAALGRAYLACGDHPRAAAELGAALGMVPFKDPTRVGGVTVAAAGDLSEPERKTQRALMLEQLATAQAAQGDTAGSAAALEEALLLRTPAPPIATWLECAARWQRAGRPDRAAGVLSAAQARLGADPVAALAVATALRDLGDVARALVIARSVWEREPRNVEATLLVGALHEARGETRAAWEVYNLSARLLPSDPRLAAALKRASGYISP